MSVDPQQDERLQTLSTRSSSPPVAPSVLDSRALDYLREEQKQRRQEVDRLIARFDADQRFGLVITGGTWSWFGTHSAELQRPFMYVAAFLPAVLMGFFMWRRRALSGAIARNAEYIGRLEGVFGLPDGFGWERSLKRSDRVGLGSSTRMFWYGLLIANLALALLFMRLLR